MANLEEDLNNTISNFLKSEDYQNMLTKHVSSAVNDSVRDMCGWNGVIQKAIKDTVEKVFNIDPDRLTAIPILQKQVLEVLNNELSHISDQARQDIMEKVNKYIPLKREKDTINLSEIIEHYANNPESRDDVSLEYVKVWMESSSSSSDWLFVYYDQEQDDHRSRAQVHLSIDGEKRLRYYKCFGAEAPTPNNMEVQYEQHTKFLFDLYLQGVKIINDVGLYPDESRFPTVLGQEDY